MQLESGPEPDEMLLCIQKFGEGARCTGVSSYLCAPKLTTHTAPELKWLLVERATLAGDLDKLRAQHSHLAAEIARVQDTLQAFDTAIRLTEARARPDAAGVIRRHQPKYGRRGALKAFVVEMLQGATSGMTTREVTQASAVHFGLPFVNESDFLVYLNHTVRPQLYKLARAGLVLSTQTGGQGTLRWEWKRGLPSLSELAVLAGAAQVATAASGAPDGHQDPSGHQMVNQRDGHASG